MKNSAVFNLTSCALMAALMCVLCPLSVPIGPVPVSMSTLVILFTVYIIGTKRALVSYVVYLLLGAVGMPVFSGFQGGLAKLAGPTGGYLIGFIPMILIAGYIIKKTKENYVISFVGMALGIAAAYFFGTVWFVLMMKCEVGYALSVCVFPFIPFDLAKIVIAAVLGRILHSALLKAKLLPQE